MNLDHQLAVADMITEEHLRPDRVGDGKDRITVDALNTAQLDSLPFGAIQLNHEGIILNTTITNRGSPESTNPGPSARISLPRSLPVPMSRNSADGSRRESPENKLHEIFQCHFAFKKNPQDVTVSLYYSGLTDSTWVFIRPL